ncbi:peptidase M15A [Rhizobium sp. Root708]|uniref:D-Ala-D-Ala carboxypeptidase family metallohydrolase n=1 Tax=Rhizobium sp. Root708 TaxID=1736592 RepID=UPI0006F3FA08|nr:D-Ala-D-Ala carboxypeptidase family metallohydrolase [Rhizobium sp. Root708]KRB61564.1 peptidase M15A [Rhizobium sp. Root708]
MHALEKRMPLGAVLLLTASALALAGCVSEKKTADVAADAAVPVAAAPVAPATAANAAAGTTYQDPQVTNVSGAQAQAQAPMAQQQMVAGSAGTAPANIGGLALQSTGINAQAMSIFSARRPPQNNATSTVLQQDGSSAYAPVGVSPARSSVYSTQSPVEQGQQGQVLLPQQSSQNTSTHIDPTQTASLATGALPGQTMNALYSAPKQNLLGSLSGLLQKASLPGMTRIAPNGLHIQNDKVEVACFKPNLMNVIKAVETHFGKPVLVTSGYRDPEHNRMVGGAEESMHKTCDAADIKVDGISKWDIASFIRSMPDKGGVGTYCHTDSVHVDTGKNRDWNWGCGRRSAPDVVARAL